MNAANTSVAEPAARPSIPSVRFTAFDAPTITTTATTNQTRLAEVQVELAGERQARRDVDPAQREEREPARDEELAAGLAALAQPEVPAAPDAEVVVDEADDGEPDDERDQREARCGRT